MEKSRSLNYQIAKSVLAMHIEVHNEDYKSDEESKEIDEDSLHPNYKSKLSLTPCAKLNIEKFKIPSEIGDFLKSNQSNLITTDKASHVLTATSDEGIHEREEVAGMKKRGAMKHYKFICSTSCIIG